MDETAERGGDEAETVEEAARSITREESVGSIGLWFAVLGSPAAWAGHLVINYALEEWFACSPSAQEQGELLGIPVGTFSIGVNSAMLLIAVAAGIVALRCLRASREVDHDIAERSRWMAFAGVVESALFTGIIIFGYVPAVVLGACQTTP